MLWNHGCGLHRNSYKLYTNKTYLSNIITAWSIWQQCWWSGKIGKRCDWEGLIEHWTSDLKGSPEFKFHLHFLVAGFVLNSHEFNSSVTVNNQLVCFLPDEMLKGRFPPLFTRLLSDKLTWKIHWLTNWLNKGLATYFLTDLLVTILLLFYHNTHSYLSKGFLLL